MAVGKERKSLRPSVCGSLSVGGTSKGLESKSLTRMLRPVFNPSKGVDCTVIVNYFQTVKFLQEIARPPQELQRLKRICIQQVLNCWLQ